VVTKARPARRLWTALASAGRARTTLATSAGARSAGARAAGPAAAAAKPSRGRTVTVPHWSVPRWSRGRYPRTGSAAAAAVSSAARTVTTPRWSRGHYPGRGVAPRRPIPPPPPQSRPTRPPDHDRYERVPHDARVPQARGQHIGVARSSHAGVWHAGARAPYSPPRSNVALVPYSSSSSSRRGRDRMDMLDRRPPTATWRQRQYYP